MAEPNRSVTERGFTIYDEFADSYGGRIRVQESGAAMEPRCWIFIDGNPGVPHLNVEQAKRVRDALDAFITEAAPHADRPHEIFAEDFRVLFGDALANYSGSIENPALVYPRRVEGLEEFMLDLAGVLRAPALRVTPNPSRGPLRFYRTGQAGRPIDLFDAQGRRVATVAPVPTAAGEQWTWGGTDGGGRRQVGVLFARLRDAAGPATRVTLLP